MIQVAKQIVFKKETQLTDYHQQYACMKLQNFQTAM